MKIIKITLVAIFLLLNFAIAQPSWADIPNFTTGSDYTEVTQAINNLLQAKDAPDRAGYAPEEIEQQLGDLKLQKYILETARGWSRCRNETGKTIGIYAHKGEKASSATNLYFLGNGQRTDNDWNCDGIYLPSGTKVAGLTSLDPQGEGLAEPFAIKIVNGTQLVAKTNPTTGEVEFNVPLAKVFKAGEGNWSIPNLSPAQIDATVPNSPD